MQIITALLYQPVSKEHWGFDDPAGKDWSEFQRVRDEIGDRIKQFKEVSE